MGTLIIIFMEHHAKGKSEQILQINICIYMLHVVEDQIDYEWMKCQIYPGPDI